MTWLLLALGSAGFVEVLLRLPFRRLLGDLVAVANKARKTILSRPISDHWKEKVLLAYSRRILLDSLGLLAIVLGACAPVAVALVIAHLLGLLLLQLLNSVVGIAVASLVAIVYLRLRRYVTG